MAFQTSKLHLVDLLQVESLLQKCPDPLGAWKGREWNPGGFSLHFRRTKKKAVAKWWNPTDAYSLFSWIFFYLENQWLWISSNFTPKTSNPVALKNGTLGFPGTGKLKNMNCFFLSPLSNDFGRCLQKHPRYEGMEAELYHRVAWWKSWTVHRCWQVGERKIS